MKFSADLQRGREFGASFGCEGNSTWWLEGLSWRIPCIVWVLSNSILFFRCKEIDFGNAWQKIEHRYYERLGGQDGNLLVFGWGKGFSVSSDYSVARQPQVQITMKSAECIDVYFSFVVRNAFCTPLNMLSEGDLFWQTLQLSFWGGSGWNLFEKSARSRCFRAWCTVKTNRWVDGVDVGSSTLLDCRLGASSAARWLEMRRRLFNWR